MINHHDHSNLSRPWSFHKPWGWDKPIDIHVSFIDFGTKSCSWWLTILNGNQSSSPFASYMGVKIPGGFLSHGGTPKSSIYWWIFQDKPSSYWGYPMTLETTWNHHDDPIKFRQNLCGEQLQPPSDSPTFAWKANGAWTAAFGRLPSIDGRWFFLIEESMVKNGGDTGILPTWWYVSNVDIIW